jgi:hypothetical protein
LVDTKYEMPIVYRVTRASTSDKTQLLPLEFRQKGGKGFSLLREVILNSYVNLFPLRVC